MMFSGTMPDDIKKVCRKFMQEQIEVVVEDNSKLVLHGLDYNYVNLLEKKKLETLVGLLNGLPFN
jgi:superfamily II DNA/RNA helicase